MIDEEQGGFRPGRGFQELLQASVIKAKRKLKQFCCSSGKPCKTLFFFLISERNNNRNVRISGAFNKWSFETQKRPEKET